MIKKCIDMGWTSVMIDGSHLPFEQNLSETRKVVNWATAAKIGVEAEIGQILGVEDDMVVAEHESIYTDPNEAEKFCRELDLSAFAAAIGTAHGYYKGEPKVQFGLIEEINKRTKVPMALHGGTGLSDEIIQRCIKLGCAKINISTNLKHVFIDSFADYHTQNPKDYEPLRVLEAQYKALKQLFKEKIAQFGGSNRAAEVLSKVA
jgi:ketose-bisphosphate aldolase